MPWIADAHVRRWDKNRMFVDMTIAKGPLRRRFSSIGTLHRPHRIDITSTDPMFDRFEQQWLFEAAPTGGTDVSYSVDVRLRSRMLQLLLGASFAGEAAATIEAFTRRAHQLYCRG